MTSFRSPSSGLALLRSLRSRFAGAHLSGAVLAVLTLVSLLPAAPALAQRASRQEAPPPPPPAEATPGIFGEIIDVRVVNIEVVVENRRGERITDLGPEDFRLEVDGETVPVEFFSEVRGGLAVEPASADAAPAVAGMPSVAPGQPVSTSYLVFIDDYFSIERDRNRVLEALRKELPFLNPEDRMAVVAFDGSRLSMLSSWSQSQAGLDRALKEAVRRPAFGLQRVSEQRRLFNNTDLRLLADQQRLQFDEISNQLNAEQRDYVFRLTHQIESQIDAAAATLRSFAMPPGRKVMLLLSGGWAFDPPSTVADDPNRPVLDAEFKRGFELFEPLVNTANTLGYTVYPIDVPGLDGTSGVDASSQTGSVGPTPASLSGEYEVQASLGFIAERTGGRAMLNSASLEPLARTASDTRSYYWLGFTPQRQWDDGDHDIDVEVLQKGLRVRSREGYLDFSRQAEVTAMVESTLLFGTTPPQEGPGALPVQMGEPKKARRGQVEVPLRVAIPVDAITVLPMGGKYVSEAELRIAVIDEDGNRAEIPVIPLKIEGEKEPTGGGYLRYETSVKLRKKKHEIVVALFDPASGRILSNRVEVAP